MSDRDGRDDGRNPSDAPRPPKRSKPAGWYTDPSGQFDLRYFDGRWTEHVANDGDDQTYVDPVPAARPTWPDRPAPRAPVDVDTAARASTKKRRFLKLPLWVWAGVAIIVVVAIAVNPSDDEPVADGDVTTTAAASPNGPQTTTAQPAAQQVVGDANEVADVGSCSLVDDDTLTVEVTNNSSKMSSYAIDINYLDATGQRIGDETFFINHLRPGEKSLEPSHAFGASDAASCEVAEVERIAAESPDDPSEVTCEVTGVDVIGDLAVTLRATNSSSKVSDYLVAASLLRDGVRIGTVDATIDNVRPGESAPTEGFTTTDGPADGVSCEVVHVDRLASE